MLIALLIVAQAPVTPVPIVALKPADVCETDASTGIIVQGGKTANTGTIVQGGLQPNADGGIIVQGGKTARAGIIVQGGLQPTTPSEPAATVKCAKPKP